MRQAKYWCSRNWRARSTHPPKARAIFMKAKLPACWPPTWSAMAASSRSRICKITPSPSASRSQALIAATALLRRLRPVPAAPASCKCWACSKDRATRKSGAGSAAELHFLAETMRRYFADRAITWAIRTSSGAARKTARPGLHCGAAEIHRSGSRHTERTDSPGQTARSRKQRNHSLLDRRCRRQRGRGDLHTQRRIRQWRNVPGLGFLLNNEMDDFAAKPGEPNPTAWCRARPMPFSRTSAPLFHDPHDCDARREN